MTEENKVIQLPVNPTNIGELEQSAIKINVGEMVLYVKFVGLLPQTLKDCPDLATHIDGQPAFLFAGPADEIKNLLISGFEEMAENYKKAVEE